GCSFHPRCFRAMEVCSREVPPLVEKAGGHSVACWLYS
ncbi:MAG: oligopeptide ABC transporter ATP-binding protein, partial [Synergistaceae bacterium]|nr:oligopeptide ABC transporter ATP-binding protein [Synergistaceae bacterium]